MLLGTVSVMGSAYTAYRDSAIVYNDVDKPVFTVDQYASMALDEVDRMLAEEQIKLDVYVLTLDLTSIDAALDCIANVFTTLGSLKGLLGDVQNLNLNALKVNNDENGVARARLNGSSGNTEDIDIIYALLKFLSDNGPTIFSSYVNNTISLGVLQSVVADYLFNVRELVTGLLYGLIAPKDAEGNKYDYMDDGPAAIPEKYNASGAKGAGIPTDGFDVLLQDLLNYFVLGEWVCLDDYFTANDGKGVPVINENGEQAQDEKGNLLFTKREFKDYDFGPNNTVMNVATKDYYGWLHRSEWVTYALGGTAVVNNGATAPDPVFDTVDISSNLHGYEFIENLMRVAYNKIAVPELNDVTRPWLRETCGIVYLDKYTDPSSPDYNPNYTGEPYDPAQLQTFAGIFALDTMEVPEAVVDYGETFVGSINDIFGVFLENVLVTERNGVPLWTWIYSSTRGDQIPNNNDGNQYLFTNIVNVAKFVLKETGGAFFADYVDVLEDTEIDALSGQGVVAYVLRSILNASIDWLFIPDDEDNDTIAEVCFTICVQLAYQDIPQFTYTKPVKGSMTDAEYNTVLVNDCLDILLDVAVYNLNQNLDMSPATGTNPTTSNNGLLQYEHNYESLVLQIVCWAFKNYGSAVIVPLACKNATGSTTGLDINDVWGDLDSLINAIVPISGPTAWINASISAQDYVVKSLLFDNIIGAVTNLNPMPLDAIFQKNPSGGFATETVKDLAMLLVTNITNNLLLANFLDSYENFDAVLQNNVLAGLVEELLAGLYSRRVDLIAVILPIVCDALGLSAEQEFEEIEIYLPSLVNATTAPASGKKFAIYNGSSGLNTAFKRGSSAREQDNLYIYDITSVVVNVNNATTGAAVDNHGIIVNGIGSSTMIGGGQSVQAAIGGDLLGNVGNIVEIQISYDVLGEDGTSLTDASLSSSAYAYISDADGGDDVVKATTSVGSNEIKYTSDIYLGRGDGLSGLESYAIEVKTPAATSINLVSTTVSGSVPFITTSSFAPVAQTVADGRYYPTPMKVAAYNDEIDYSRSTPIYTKNTENLPDFESEFTGEYSAEPGEVPNGVYTVTTTLNIGGTNKTITTRIHLYDDFNIESAFNNAVGTNRQRSDYDMDKNSGAGDDLFTAYQTAIRNAANAALSNKSGANFETFIKTGTGINPSSGITQQYPYVNLYHKYAEELDAAIEALKDYELTAGFTALRNAIVDISPYNYSYIADGAGFVKTIIDPETNRTELEYNEVGYSFFGMRDFIPHTYARYKEERNDAQNLINQQMIFKPLAPINPGADATEDELYNYNKALEQYTKDLEHYNKALLEIPALGTIDAAYAQHMVELTGSRLLYVKANISKLQLAYNLYNYTNGTAANLQCTTGNANGWYLASRWDAYVEAVDFAAATLAIGVDALDNNGNPVLRPSRVNTAISNLVEAWKRLARGADKTQLNGAISNAASRINTPTFTAAYTQESRDALINAKNAAELLVDAEMAATEANNRILANAVSAISAAILGLEEVASDPVYEFPTVAPGVFTDVMGMGSYTPTINYNMDSFYGGYFTNTSFVTGLGEYIDESTISSNLFSTLENATVTVTPNPDSGMCGTGTKVDIVDSNDAVVQSYYLVISGDITGDSVVDGTDLGEAEYRYAGFYYWSWDCDDSFWYNYELAGDIAGGDCTIDGSDCGEFAMMYAGLGYIDQDLCTLVYF